MRILVTGATGFFGKHLIPKIMQIDSLKLAILVRNYKKSIVLFGKYEPIQIIDSTNTSFKQEIKDFNPDAVIHLASLLTSKDDEETINKILNVNIEMGTHLLDALKGTRVQYFINVGTCAEYYYNDSDLRSANLYAATKTAFRSILKYYQQILKFKWVNIIPYTVYGGADTQQKVIDYLISSLDSDEIIGMSGGEQRLDFIHIDDVVDFFITLLKNTSSINKDFTELHLGTGKGTSIKELSQIIESVYSQKVNVEWGALPYRQNDIMQAVAHTVKNKEILNWETKIDLKAGIEKMKRDFENV